MKTFIINLEKEKTKKKYMVDMCNRFKLDFEICKAIDGSKLSSTFLKENIYDYPNCFLTKGEIGCALSHYNIYKEIINRRLPYALILEDDAIIDNRTIEFINAFKKNKKQGIFLLTGDFLYIKNKKFNMKNFTIFYVIKASRTTGYIITQEVAKKLAEFLIPIRYEADMFEIFSSCTNINIYGTIPHLIETNDKNKICSSIEKERAPLFSQRELYRANLFEKEKRKLKKYKYVYLFLKFFKKKIKSRHYKDY